MTRITIARMHRDPHTNELYPREIFPQFFSDPEDAKTAVAALEGGAHPDFYQPGKTGVSLALQALVYTGTEFLRAA